MSGIPPGFEAQARTKNPGAIPAIGTSPTGYPARMHIGNGYQLGPRGDPVTCSGLKYLWAIGH